MPSFLSPFANSLHLEQETLFLSPHIAIRCAAEALNFSNGCWTTANWGLICQQDQKIVLNTLMYFLDLKSMLNSSLRTITDMAKNTSCKEVQTDNKPFRLLKHTEVLLDLPKQGPPLCFMFPHFSLRPKKQNNERRVTQCIQLSLNKERGRIQDRMSLWFVSFPEVPSDRWEVYGYQGRAGLVSWILIPTCWRMNCAINP